MDMVAGARTFPIEETLLEPPALNPPPTRHALLVLLVALAAVLHLGTTGWGEVYGETEGQYAGAAREMIAAHEWSVPTNDGVPRLQKPPLLYWLIILSFKAFGVNAMMASPLAHGLFRRAIVESYPMFGISSPTQTLTQAEEGGQKFAASVGA